MAALSVEVAKLEEERRQLLAVAAEAVRFAVGEPVFMFRVQDHYVLGHRDEGSSGEFLGVHLTRDLANEIACTANGVTVSGSR